jgi:hypothetical protein
VGGNVITTRMWRLTGLGECAAVIGFALIMGSSVAQAQIEGAVQYPPHSIGEDAQPPPPARMAPQSVSPRKIELGGSGSSQLPGNYQFPFGLRTGVGEFASPGAARIPLSASSPPTAGGN